MDLGWPHLNFTLERQFHCLRHFSFQNKEQISHFQHQFPTYSGEQIQQQLEMVGSKFHDDFAREPMAILRHLEKAPHIQRPIENNKTLFQFTFSQIDFPKGIGKSALIAVGQLDEAQQVRKYKVKRGEIEVWTCEVAELPTSNLLSIIAMEKAGVFDIITLFPGDYAPAFPRGTSELDEQNRMFWEGHCLLREK
jgi:hypothetical protein